MAAVNKNKHLENATKHVQRGQLDRAVKELQKILEHDAGDIQVRLKVAGLLARTSKPEDAIKNYDHVASHYVKEGFNARAVAVYELMVKIDTQRVDLHMKLGDLYAVLFRRADALREYQIVATYFDGKGKAAESLEVLRKMAEISPENARVRRKLAELMVQGGQAGEAKAELERLADTLRQKGDAGPELADVLDRIAALAPKDLPSLRAAARTHLDRRDPRRALARLQGAFGIDPHDAGTLALLAEAFIALGNRVKALAVLRELAKIHDRAGRLPERDEVWREVQRLEPNDPDALDALDPPIPLTERTIDEVQEPLVYEGGRDRRVAVPADDAPAAASYQGPMSVARLLNEADIYLRYGMKAKALEYLEQALAKDPKCLSAVPRLAAFHRKVLAGEVSVPAQRIGDMVPPTPQPGFVEVSVEVSQVIEAMTGPTAKLREELDEAEFFLRQELFDEAIAIFRSLATRFPKEPQIREKLKAAEAALARDRAAKDPPGRMPLAKIALVKVPASEVARPKPKKRESEFELDLGGAANIEIDAAPQDQVSVADVLLELSGEMDLGKQKKSDYELGLTYRDMGLNDEALAAFEKAAGDPERAAEARQQIGLIRLERGDVEGALKSLRKATELATAKQRPSIEFSYGTALETAGRFQEAAALYRRLLEHKNGRG